METNFPSLSWSVEPLFVVSHKRLVCYHGKVGHGPSVPFPVGSLRPGMSSQLYNISKSRAFSSSHDFHFTRVYTLGNRSLVCVFTHSKSQFIPMDDSIFFLEK